jgi:hypothetical protein
MARSSLFLNQWLIAQTAKPIGVREVFSRFKYFTTHDSNAPMGDLLPTIHRAALDYQAWTEAARTKDGAVHRLTLFVYRIGALDSEATKPLLIWLRDPAWNRWLRPSRTASSHTWRVGSFAGPCSASLRRATPT